MAKKKLKKMLKMLGAGAAIAGLGKAFMANRNRNSMLSSADANDGFRAIFKRPNMRDVAGGPFRSNPMLTEEDYNSDFFTGAMAKKGGRIKKTKRGGRAVRKANRSKKK